MHEKVDLHSQLSDREGVVYCELQIPNVVKILKGTVIILYEDGDLFRQFSAIGGIIHHEVYVPN